MLLRIAVVVVVYLLLVVGATAYATQISVPAIAVWYVPPAGYLRLAHRVRELRAPERLAHRTLWSVASDLEPAFIGLASFIIGSGEDDAHVQTVFFAVPPAAIASTIA